MPCHSPSELLHEVEHVVLWTGCCTILTLSWRCCCAQPGADGFMNSLMSSPFWFRASPHEPCVAKLAFSVRRGVCPQDYSPVRCKPPVGTGASDQCQQSVHPVPANSASTVLQPIHADDQRGQSAHPVPANSASSAGDETAVDVSPPVPLPGSGCRGEAHTFCQ